jgi:hypothetical protein
MPKANKFEKKSKLEWCHHIQFFGLVLLQITVVKGQLRPIQTRHGSTMPFKDIDCLVIYFK